jgi:replicative DNA helicase
MIKLFNLDIERAILNSIIQDNEKFEEVSNILTSKDFYNPFHQTIYQEISKLSKEQDFIDEFILREELEKSKYFDETEFFEILATTPVENVDEYAKIIKELAIKRQLELLLKKNSINIAKKDTFELIEALKKELEDINKQNTDTFKLKTFSIVENRDIEFILKDFLPIPKKAVTLLSAKGGAGKSWLVLQLALKFINQTEKKVFAWLSEDPDFATKKRAEKILNEILINHNNTKYFDINHPIYNNFCYLGSETRPFHFIKYDYKNKKINTLFYKLKHTLRDFDFIILDPLIAFYGGDENNNSQAREFMNLLAEWADKEDKAILVVHHNNKSTTGGIRGASAFVDAVRLQYQLYLPSELNEESLLPNNFRIIKIMKDNWGVEKILNKKEIEIEIFGKEGYKNVQR